MCLQQNLTGVYEKINSNKLSMQEIQVCVLTFIGMNNSEVAILLGVASNVVCNAKKRANQKIFGGHSASSLYENLKICVGQVWQGDRKKA